MTSKECLERLLKIAYVESGPTKEKFITYARETEHNKKCLDLYNTIKQDLERLEELKEEHYDLLKSWYKLKKVIKILKDKFELFIFESDNIHYVGNEYAVGKLIQEEYELLKEVLYNEIC